MVRDDGSRETSSAFPHTLLTIPCPGMCCNFGRGSYGVTYMGGTVVQSNGKFTKSETTEFGECPPEATATEPPTKVSARFNNFQFFFSRVEDTPHSVSSVVVPGA